MTAAEAGMGSLSEHHRHMLCVESGLSAQTVTQRGYRTVRGTDGSAELATLGFNLAQARTAERGDALLVPLYDTTGAVVSHQIRPDVPRLSQGNPIKYETPAHVGNRVDVPPAGRDVVMDGTSPLWVTEGAKTADALAQAGAGVLMLCGVWGFMGRSAQGIGTAVVADLAYVPMAGRTVYLAYDSDVVTKESVQAAERRLAETLSGRGAAVFTVRIPSGSGGIKQGADDFLAAGGTLDALVATAAAPTATDPLGGKSPQRYAYDLVADGHELAVDTTGAFLLRPVDAAGLPAGPARRYSRLDLQDRTLSLAGARGAVTLPQSAVTHAVSRHNGDHIDQRVGLPPSHITRVHGVTWLDMGTGVGHDVVRLSADGWGYASWSDVPLWLVRGDTTVELTPPASIEQRSWEPLRRLLALDDESFAVIRVWLVALLVTDRVPLLWWRGAAGAGKSTRADLVSAVLGLPGLSAAPLNMQDAYSKLQESPWMQIENLGALDPAMSDLWCTAIADGVVSTRILHTSRQVRVTGRWTGQVTSVRDVPGALDDLMSRALTVDVPVDTTRRLAADLHAEMREHAPLVRGALLDDAVAVLRRFAAGDLRTGSYRFPALTAIAHALDVCDGVAGIHAHALGDAASETTAERSENDPWVRWLADETRRCGGCWTATAAEIFDAQRAHRRSVTVALADEVDQWPTSAKQVGWWLPTREGRLRALGVEWRKGRRTAERRPHVLRVLGGNSVVPPKIEEETTATTSEQNPRSTRVSDNTDISVFNLQKSYRDKSEVQPLDTLTVALGDKQGGIYGDADLASETPGTTETLVDLGVCADKPQTGIVIRPEGNVSAHRCSRLERRGDPTPCSLNDTREGLVAVVRAEGALTVDVETTGYPVGHADYALRTVQLGGATCAWVFDVRDGEGAHEVRALVRDFLAVVPKLHAHSATADLVPLAHAGLIDHESGWQRMFDTVIPAKLADPQSTGSGPGLKALAGAVLGEQATAPAADEARAALFKRNKWVTNTKVTTAVERSGWAQVDPADSVMLRYAASDVLDTAVLAQRLPWPDAALLERERVTQRMTARVAYRGLRVDADHVAAKRTEHTDAQAVAAERVRAAGVADPGSNKQVGEKLAQLGASLPRTARGAPSVAEGAIEPLRADQGAVGELVRAVLDYRHHTKALSAFLEPYAQLCARGDGRVRPTIYTLAADTGRMSCVRLNLQQVPREGGFRACITADPGHVLISADFSGVEIRGAAALSQDATLIKLIAEEDAGRSDGLHWLIARQVFGPDATKADRYTAKRVVFGRLYGGAIATLAKQAGTSELVVASAIDVLDATTPQLTQWSHAIRNAVKAGSTQFPTYSGRTIHLPREYPHKGPNYCIQGTCRELLVDALTRWRDTKWGDCTILPVHDEIVAMVPEADADEATAELVACMRGNLHGVPIMAEASAPSFAWADSV